MSKRVTQCQLDALRNILLMGDYKDARQAVRDIGITADTLFTTAGEKDLALRVYARLINPDDYGAIGKLQEIAHRVNASKSPMPWSSFHARRSGLADQTVKLDGVTYSLEHKSSNGDFFATHEDTLETAFAKWSANPHKILVWDTEEFTLIIPANELLNALNAYRLGWRTFFALVERNGCRKVYCQPYRTSKRKTAFLRQLAEEYVENLEKFSILF